MRVITQITDLPLEDNRLVLLTVSYVVSYEILITFASGANKIRTKESKHFESHPDIPYEWAVGYLDFLHRIERKRISFSLTFNQG